MYGIECMLRRSVLRLCFVKNKAVRSTGQAHGVITQEAIAAVDSLVRNNLLIASGWNVFEQRIHSHNSAWKVTIQKGVRAVDFLLHYWPLTVWLRCLWSIQERQRQQLETIMRLKLPLKTDSTTNPGISSPRVFITSWSIGTHVSSSMAYMFRSTTKLFGIPTVMPFSFGRPLFYIIFIEHISQILKSK